MQAAPVVLQPFGSASGRSVFINDDSLVATPSAHELTDLTPS